MFSKKPEVSYDFSSDIENFLNRTDALEQESVRVARHMQMKSLEWDTKISEFRRQIRHCKLETDELKKSTYNLKENFMSVVEMFKPTASQEDLEKLKKKIETWQIENLITRREFFRMLENNFKNRE